MLMWLLNLDFAASAVVPDLTDYVQIATEADVSVINSEIGVTVLGQDDIAIQVEGNA